MSCHVRLPHSVLILNLVGNQIKFTKDKMEKDPLVVKKIIYAGKKYIPIADGSKVHFHFQTWKVGKQRTLLDDSKKIGTKQPMVLVIGHKFQLEVWESIVKMMAVGEVASFTVKKDLVLSYPLVSKTLRELGQEGHRAKHTCTMTLQTEGIGFSDLDELIAYPCDLEFIIEILKIELPNEYEKETWQMDMKERLDVIPALKEKGNQLYLNKKYEEAESTYYQALSMLEQLLVRERKQDDEWKNLNNMKLPILLNYAQCKLVKNDYYSVIEHCSTVLEYEPDNEKALFRRAKAHVGAWNPDQAEQDFKHLKSLNASLSSTIDKELENIKQLRKQKSDQDKSALKNLFSKQKSNDSDTKNIES